MILFSHPLVKNEPLPEIFDFERGFKGKDFVLVSNKLEAVIANANGVKYIVCDNLSLAKQLQALANDYLFDSKIAIIVKSDDELIGAIDARIDASIYKSF